MHCHCFIINNNYKIKLITKYLDTLVFKRILTRFPLAITNFGIKSIFQSLLAPYYLGYSTPYLNIFHIAVKFKDAP